MLRLIAKQGIQNDTDLTYDEAGVHLSRVAACYLEEDHQSDRYNERTRGTTKRLSSRDHRLAESFGTQVNIESVL